MFFFVNYNIWTGRIWRKKIYVPSYVLRFWNFLVLFQNLKEKNICTVLWFTFWNFLVHPNVIGFETSVLVWKGTFVFWNISYLQMILINFSWERAFGSLRDSSVVATGSSRTDARGQLQCSAALCSPDLHRLQPMLGPGLPTSKVWPNVNFHEQRSLPRRLITKTAVLPACSLRIPSGPKLSINLLPPKLLWLGKTAHERNALRCMTCFQKYLRKHLRFCSWKTWVNGVF